MQQHPKETLQAVEKEIIITADGSSTITIPELNLSYHSLFGAVQESMHIFIEAGFRYCAAGGSAPQMCIFEMGFGTGLNAFLTAMEAQRKKMPVWYTALEKNPVSISEAKMLNYPDLLGHKELFLQLHECTWEKQQKLTPFFAIKKHAADLLQFCGKEKFDLVYFDAFDPAAQALLWSTTVFEKMFYLLRPNGVLVTYCSKGEVRRSMTAAGFIVKKLPGPPGKKEIVRAMKP